MNRSITSFIHRLVSRPGWVVALLIVVAMGVTWGLGRWEIARFESSGIENLIAWRQQAFEDIDDRTTATFESLFGTARQIANADELGKGFLARGESPGSSERIVRFIAGMDLEKETFIEVYDQSPTLIAWKGPAFPMDQGVSNPDFLLKPVESVALDGGKRTALVVWVPVLDGTSVLGAVRAGQIVESYMPIKNDFLRDYSWGEDWSRALKVTVAFAFGSQQTVPGENERPLISPTGSRVGTVKIDLPAVSTMAQDKADGYNDFVAFWIFLFLMWVLYRWTTTVWNWFGNNGYFEGPGTDAGAPPQSVHPEGIRGSIKDTSIHVGSYIVLLLSIRWSLLWMDIPSRWQPGKSPLAPLFDPQHLASVFGFGALRTIGDLFISAVFITMGCIMLLRATYWIRSRAVSGLHFDRHAPIRARLVWAIALHALVVGLISGFLFAVSSHTILDSTLDYFARSGLLPERLILVVFSALLMIVLSAILVGGRMAWVSIQLTGVDTSRLPTRRKVLLLYVVLGAVIGILLNLIGVGAPIVVLAAMLTVMLVSAGANPFKPAHRSPLIALRYIVPVVIVTSAVLFPMLEISAYQKTELRMKDAAISFLEDKDSRVMFSISQVLDTPSLSSIATEVLTREQISLVDARLRLDSLAEETTRGFLLSALSGYDVTVTIHDLNGKVLGRYSNLSRRIPRAARDAADESDFGLFLAMYKEFGENGAMIEKLTGLKDQNRFRYAGFQRDPNLGPFYMLVRAEQRALTESAGTPFPKVLSPAGYYGNRYADLSVAEFKDGILIRSQGESFGRYFLDQGVLQKLQKEKESWLTETIKDRTYQTFYRVDNALDAGPASSVIAVRRRTTNFFDRLYHLLRIVVAGLFLAAPFYAGGVLWRLLESKPRSEPKHFRDRVLNAFFSVGVITVVAMGFVGLRVVTGENDRAIESWLRQHLDRVEETLQLEATGEELPYRVLDRISIDSLSARVGLDLIIFHGSEVDQSSRPELIRDKLIEKRLPVEAYQALYFDGFRFVTVNEMLGSFEYTAGYRALTDERGLPHYVVSIPTLPEQERIEEERARTVAYLFGALLLLVLVVMVTASLLANALTRPIMRLRAGLQSVAAGHFERIAQIKSGDEIGDLVDSFNTMQDQLEQSQRLIGQQERQLAWKEMARQVAHEIKNPLTPMRLSIQHMQAAWTRRDETKKGNELFAKKFDQTTNTLIEQIDTLARIANEFSTFGRMPTHVREEVEVNAVIREAVELMQAEDNVRILVDLSPDRFVVQADREALRRVYVNFLKNSIQSVPDDRMAEILVTTTTVEEGGKRFVLSKVTDNGSGIPRNLWEKIFVPSFSTKTSGTGLGLAIARKTVENMDGDIGFDTEFEKGTTFWIKIPMMPA